MELKTLPHELSVCKLESADLVDLSKDLVFLSRTPDEISLACETNDVPTNTVEREDGWRGLMIQGVLDFSLVGILSDVSSILAKAGVGIFAISTYNTDYILVKERDLARAVAALQSAGHTVAS